MMVYRERRASRVQARKVRLALRETQDPRGLRVCRVAKDSKAPGHKATRVGKVCRAIKATRADRVSLGHKVFLAMATKVLKDGRVCRVAWGHKAARASRVRHLGFKAPRAGKVLPVLVCREDRATRASKDLILACKVRRACKAPTV